MSQLGLSALGLGLAFACDLPADETLFRTFAESPGISEAIGISATGHVVGMREVRTGQNILRRMPYLYRDNRLFEIPVLEGYTNIEVTGVTDPGWVFGYATRVPGTGTANPCGFLWDSYSGKSLALPPPLGYSGSNLLDATPEASKLVGYAVGNSPPRLQPCVWTRDEHGNFTPEVLPTPQLYNPFLQTARVAISPDGKLVAATVLSEDAQKSAYETYQWALTEKEHWVRERRSTEGLRVADIDNSGLLIGNVQRGPRWLGAVCRPGQASLQLLALPEGYAETNAVGIGPQETIVGTCEGPEIGPTSWIWNGTQLTMVDLPVEFHWLVVTAINSRGDLVGYYGPAATKAQEETDYDRTLSFSARWPLPSK